MKKIYPSKKPFFKIQKEADEKCESMRNIDPYQSALEKLKNTKPKKQYAWRKRNTKKRKFEKIYKPYPPKDPFKSRDYQPEWKRTQNNLTVNKEE